MDRYWLSPDDDDFDFGGGFDDGSGADDFDDGQDDGSDDGADDAGSDEEDDAGNGDDGGDNGDGGDGGDNGDDGGDGDNGDGDVFLDASDFPNATDADFTDDNGEWTPDDYRQSAENIFGSHEYFGDDLISQRADEGFQLFDDPAFAGGFEQAVPGSTETVRLFEREGALSAFGFVTMAALEMLRMRYSGIDFSNLEVSVPPKGDPPPPQPLPAELAAVQEKDAVDLRKYCSPVGDQGQTARCAAFAWTHAVELSRNLLNEDSPRLSPSYSMLQFQRMQGDARDYSYAHQGGDGTIAGPDPAEVLVERGTCRQEYWPDEAETPSAPEREMDRDASQHRLDGEPLPIALDDVKKVLSAGCPVQVSMNTGPAFMQVGRDGVFNAAEPPSGRHGRHAMLITGYAGNFYIVKNSWGADWGDQGYCYIPKAVLAASEPDFVAVLLRAPAVSRGTQTASSAARSGASRSGGSFWEKLFGR